MVSWRRMLAFAVMVLIAANPDRAAADALFSAGRYPEAALGYIALLRQAPTDPDLLDAAGRSLLALGAPQRAIPFFEREVALRPQQLEALRSLSEALLGAGRFDEAHRLLERLTAANSLDTVSWARLGTLLYRNGYYPGAIDAFDRALHAKAAFPGNTNAIEVLRAIALVETGSTAEAGAVLPGLLARPENTANLDLLLSSVRLLYETGRYQEALRQSDRALAAGPANAAVHLWRARLFHEEDRLPEAVVEAERARELAPSSPAPRSLLVRLYEHAGRGDDAEREAAWLRNNQAAADRNIP